MTKKQLANSLMASDRLVAATGLFLTDGTKLNEMDSRKGPWSWTVNHFTQSNRDGPERMGHVLELLRRVASTIDELGSVEIQDVTFGTTVAADGYEHTITVYFHNLRPDGERPELRRVK